MYYILNEHDNLNDIIKMAENMRFVNSEWSVNKDNCVAVALYYNPLSDKNQQRIYILLNKVMAGIVPGFDNWIEHRIKYMSVEDMFSAMETMIAENSK